MNKKKLIKFLQVPTSLRYAQIEKILIDFDFTKRHVRSSHVKFSHPKLERGLIISLHGKDCKDGYKEEVARIIKKYFSHEL